MFSVARFMSNITGQVQSALLWKLWRFYFKWLEIQQVCRPPGSVMSQSYQGDYQTMVQYSTVDYSTVQWSIVLFCNFTVITTSVR